MGQVVQLVRLAPEQDDSGSRDTSGRSSKGNGHPTITTLLIVEDEILVRLAVADYLRDCGHRILEASSAEEAQAILRSGEPVEILFSDINLGAGLSGFDLARWVREEYPSVRILLASGVAWLAGEAENLCDGPVLVKPYSFDSLGEHVKRLLGAFGRRTG